MQIFVLLEIDIVLIPENIPWAQGIIIMNFIVVHEDTMFFQCMQSSEMLFHHYGDAMSIYILEVKGWPEFYI